MDSINRPKLVREHNLSILRRVLFSVRQATRQELSRLTGISTVTLGTLLQELVKNGDALELQTVQPKSGRPAQVYSFNPRLRYGLSLFAQSRPDGFLLRSSLFDMYGTIVHQEEIPSVFPDEAGTYRLLQRLTSTCRPVKAIVIGLPGIGSEQYLYQHLGNQIFSLSAVKEFQAETGIPVELENDVNLAVIGYAQSQKLSDVESVVYFYLYRSCYGGSALYLNGRLHTGKDRFAGEMAPEVFGVDWSRADTENSDVIISNLLQAALPYVSILAPDRMVIASDYITEPHLSAVEEKLHALFGDRHCPKLFLSHQFQEEYALGIRHLVMKQITNLERGA